MTSAEWVKRDRTPPILQPGESDLKGADHDPTIRERLEAAYAPLGDVVDVRYGGITDEKISRLGTAAGQGETAAVSLMPLRFFLRLGPNARHRIEGGLAILAALAVILLLWRPAGNGVFYERCVTYSCEVRLHLPGVPLRDPIIAHGPRMAGMEIPGTEFQVTGPDGRPMARRLTMMTASDLARALTELPGYGPYYQPRPPTMPRPPAGGPK